MQLQSFVPELEDITCRENKSIYSTSLEYICGLLISFLHTCLEEMRRQDSKGRGEKGSEYRSHWEISTGNERKTDVVVMECLVVFLSVCL